MYVSLTEHILVPDETHPTHHISTFPVQFVTSCSNPPPPPQTHTRTHLASCLYCDACTTPADSSQPLDQWTLSEGFVAEEGRCLLPPVTATRPDLVKCFNALLLSTLIDAKLLKSLALVCLAKNTHLAVRAAILLGELIHLVRTYVHVGSFGSLQTQFELTVHLHRLVHQLTVLAQTNAHLKLANYLRTYLRTYVRMYVCT